MQRSSRKAWVALSLVLLGCSLATDFDRSKVGEINGDGGGVLPEGGLGGNDGSMPGVDAAGDGMIALDGNLDGAADARPDAPSEASVDTGTDAGTCSSNDQCAPTQLCCGGQCVATSVGSRCTSCTEGCSGAAANSCNNRTCGCDNAAACGGGMPYCVANSSGLSICSECADNTNCGNRSDGRTLCIGGRCAACDPSNNSGCSGNTPICDGTSLTCVACSMSPNNCRGNTMCTASGACGGCSADANCTTPTTPICDMVMNPTVCRGCASNAECAAKSAARPYCNTDGTCGACKLTAGAADPGCDIASAAPACRAANNTYQCLQCTNSDAHCEVAGPRDTCRGGRCVECAPGSLVPKLDAIGCTDATKPICDSTGLCISCMASGNNAAQRNAACLAADATKPLCDSGTGRCVGCLNAMNCTTDPTKPVCDATSRQCRGCTVANEATECGGATPACLATGACAPCRQGGPLTACTGANGTCSAINTCVDCIGTSEGCSGTNGSCKLGATPAMNMCVDCTGLVTGECPTGKPHCAGNTCVECTMPSDCTAMNCKTASCSVAGACSYADVVVADDGLACTNDVCNPVSGLPEHPQKPNTCVSDMCTTRVCGGAAPDVNGCTSTPIVTCMMGTCNPATGACEP